MGRIIFDDETLPEKLRSWRKEKGLDQKELAKLAGVGVSTVQRAEYGDPRITDSTIAAMMKALGIVFPHDATFEGDSDDYAPNLAFIPLMAPRLSAGSGEVVDSEEEVKSYAFRRDWLARIGSAKDMKLFKVVGDSMRPTLLNGDMVMVDMARFALEEDQVHAVARFGEIMVKRLRRNDDGRVEIISDNTSHPIRYADGTDDFRVLGRVVWLGREI